jgi:hypothetical protein
MKNNNNDTDEFVVLDRFQDYVVMSKTFRQFEWTGFDKNNQAVLYRGRIYQIHTFNHSDTSIAITVEDLRTGIKTSDKGQPQGWRSIITNHDQEIFDTCLTLANKIKEKILKEAADLKINEIKIVEPDYNIQ